MRTQNLLAQYEVLVAGAILSSHVINSDHGFRLRDVRVYLELYSNWLNFSWTHGEIRVQNTQISRYLDLLVHEGYARKKNIKGNGTFFLTRTGLVEMVTRVVIPTKTQPFDLFCMQLYLTNSYGDLARKEIARQGSQFPPALKIEIDELLNIGQLFERRKREINTQIRKLESRSKDGIDSGMLANKLFASGMAFDKIIAQMSYHHPYHMSSNRSFDEMVRVLPHDIQKWELTDGAPERSFLIWNQAISILKNELYLMDRLEKHLNAKRES